MRHVTASFSRTSVSISAVQYDRGGTSIWRALPIPRTISVCATMAPSSP